MGSYTIYLGRTAKRENSTKQSIGNGSTFEVDLKTGEATVTHPIFRVNTNYNFKSMQKFNYVKLSEAQNVDDYFWIDEIKSIHNNIYEIRCTRDPYATFASAIKAETCYVTRISQSDKISYYDDDNIISPTNFNNGVAVEEVATGFSYTSGTVISIVTYGSAGVQYDLVKDDMQTLSNTLFDNVQDLWDAVYQKLTSPAMYVKSCLLLPYDFGLDYDTGTVIKLGNAPAVNVNNAMNITDTTRLKEVTKSIAISSILGDISFYDPDSTADYRLVNSDFVRVNALVPFVGKISIPNEVLSMPLGFINVKYTIDVVTGQGECLIWANKVTQGPKFIINKSSINVGASIPIMAAYDNRATILQNIFSPAKMFSSVLNPKEEMNMIGNIDGVGYTEIDKIKFLISEVHSDDLSYATEKGRPCNQRLTLSTLTSGTYVECLNPSVTIPGATKEEINMINNTLKGGMYIE